MVDEDLERIKALRLKAAATSAQADDEERDRIAELRRRTQGHADEDLERIAALRRRTAATPSWTPEDDEELAALRLKARRRRHRRRAGRDPAQGAAGAGHDGHARRQLQHV